MTADLHLPCYGLPPAPARHRGQVHQCWCGQGWHVTTANDVFTDGPILIWARVGWWDLRARWTINHHPREVPR